MGTFAPDFEYVIRLSQHDRFGHTLVGGPLLTLPLALLVLWMFHAYVKRPLTALMPEQIQRRLASDLENFHFGGVPRFALIIASIGVGIATHLVWDLFTHSGTWLYYHWSLLSERVHLPVIGLIPCYKLLQHSSTIIGLAILFTWVGLWYRSTEPSSRPIQQPMSLTRRMSFVAAVTAIAFVGALIRGVVGVGVPHDHLTEKRFLGEIVVTAVALVWWQLVAYGVLNSANWGKRVTPENGVPMSSP